MDEEKNKKAREVMYGHLEELGHPDMQPEAVFEELEPMFRKLEEEDLIPDNYTFYHFVEEAKRQYFIKKRGKELSDMEDWVKELTEGGFML